MTTINPREPISFTNSSLTTARRCLTAYDLRYRHRLEHDGATSEALDVGSAWHEAFDAQARGENPYDAIIESAPSELWAQKLARLFAAYAWYWKDDPFEIVAAEEEFDVVLLEGVQLRGKKDARICLADGRVGLLERKTTGDSIDGDADYWKRLRLDTQVGIYALATEDRPAFILYDVVRKPTINPKGITKADAKRMTTEVEKAGFALYYGEPVQPDELATAIAEDKESLSMYGARLTADIGDRPSYYFGRREVPRTSADYQTLVDNVQAQIDLLCYAEEKELMHRNPNACEDFGGCEFFALCSHNVRPTSQNPFVPQGFRRREQTHPELS